MEEHLRKLREQAKVLRDSGDEIDRLRDENKALHREMAHIRAENRTLRNAIAEQEAGYETLVRPDMREIFAGMIKGDGNENGDVE